MEVEKGRRIPSIDFMRVIAIFAVILIHAYPFGNISIGIGKYLKVFINQGARFAVPFFFIVTGFIWGKKLASGQDAMRVFLGYGRRIAVIFIAWSVIYLVVPSDLSFLTASGSFEFLKTVYYRFLSLSDDPLMLVFQGTKEHLWFLMSLLWAMILSSALIKVDRGPWLLPLALILYLFGILAGSYAKTPYGIHIEFNTRNGPFFSTIFFVVGWLFSKHKGYFSMKTSIALLLGGLALHMVEVYVLLRFYEVNPLRHDFLLGTLPYSTGVAAIALSRPSLGENALMTKWGPYVLGIYVVHFLYVDLLGPLGGRFNPYAWGIVLPVTIFLLSLVTVKYMEKSRALRKIVL